MSVNGRKNETTYTGSHENSYVAHPAEQAYAMVYDPATKRGVRAFGATVEEAHRRLDALLASQLTEEETG